MSKILVFGASGGIGKEVMDILDSDYSHDVVGYDSIDLDFQKPRDLHNISNHLYVHCPDYIINCSGVLGGNDWLYESVYDVNLGSNWEIIKHYLKDSDHVVNIMMMGSSAYAGGRRNYMLYSSSKAALHNLWEGASENFEGTDVNLGIFHCGPVATEMIPERLTKKNLLDPTIVANNIIQATLTMTENKVYNIL